MHRLKTTQSICTIWWTCPNLWRTTRKNFPISVICCPTPWETSPRTSVWASARSSTRFWCLTSPPCPKSEYASPLILIFSSAQPELKVSCAHPPRELSSENICSNCHVRKITNFRLQHPCDGCEAPYGFKNVMGLSMDTTKFAVSVDPPISAR